MVQCLKIIFQFFTGECFMILSGKEIKKRLNSDICIEPFCEKQLNPNSYNLRLHNKLLTYTDELLDMKQKG